MPIRRWPFSAVSINSPIANSRKLPLSEPNPSSTNMVSSRTAEAALARENGCTVLRMDTNAKNAAARRLYQKLGYAEPDIVPCKFNGIPNVQLVLLEKKLT